jgi:hypothetical protein
MLDKLKALAGMKLNGVSLNIDLVNYCACACPSCAVGSIGGRQTGKMELQTFRRILDKFDAEGVKIRHIQLYVYSDPFLHPELDQFVAECTQRGIKTWLSTMLQTTKADFREVIEARPTEFRVSMPGWRYMSYYQKGARPEVFDRNFAEVVKLPRYPETVWTFAYHIYSDNSGEEMRKAYNLATEHGFKFVGLPAIFMPLEKIVEKRYSEADKVLISRLVESPEEATAWMKEKSFCACWKQITLDVFSRVYLCELIYEDRFILGDFFDWPIDYWLKRIRRDPYCGDCIKAKANVYEECYSEFTGKGDPVESANKKRRIK